MNHDLETLSPVQIIASLPRPVNVIERRHLRSTGDQCGPYIGLEVIQQLSTLMHRYIEGPPIRAGHNPTAGTGRGNAHSEREYSTLRELDTSTEF
jgi:hypothetical protein